jgi:hypothetical protein
MKNLIDGAGTGLFKLSLVIDVAFDTLSAGTAGSRAAFQLSGVAATTVGDIGQQYVSD